MARSVKFEAGGEKYTLCFSFNALCLLEEDTGKGIADLFVDNMSMSSIRAMIWAGLQDEHEGLTKKQAGDVIDAAGIDAMKDHMANALKAAFPDMVEETAGNEARGK